MLYSPVGSFPRSVAGTPSTPYAILSPPSSHNSIVDWEASSPTLSTPSSSWHTDSSTMYSQSHPGSPQFLGSPWTGSRASLSNSRSHRSSTRSSSTSSRHSRHSSTSSQTPGSSPGRSPNGSDSGYETASYPDPGRRMRQPSPNIYAPRAAPPFYPLAADDDEPEPFVPPIELLSHTPPPPPRQPTPSQPVHSTPPPPMVAPSTPWGPTQTMFPPTAFSGPYGVPPGAFYSPYHPTPGMLHPQHAAFPPYGGALQFGYTPAVPQQPVLPPAFYPTPAAAFSIHEQTPNIIPDTDLEDHFEIPDVGEIPKTLHYQLQRAARPVQDSEGTWCAFPSLQWDVVFQPMENAKYMHSLHSLAELPDWYSAAFSPDTPRVVQFTSSHEMLKTVMAHSPCVLMTWDVITIERLLQLIYDYLHEPLSTAEREWVVGTPGNKARLDDARTARCYDTLHCKPEDDMIYLRSDLLGHHRRFNGLQMTLRESGQWKVSMDFLPGSAC